MSILLENVADEQKITDFYGKFIAYYGVQEIRAAGWLSAEKVLQGYDIATRSKSQDWLDMEAVLDVGSGQGHLLYYLRQQRGYHGYYLGVELVPEFYKLASGAYASDPNAEFACAEFLSHDFEGDRFDWVFSYGSLGVAQVNQAEYARATIAKMAELSTRGFSLYVNDRQKMESVPEGLAAHDIWELAHDINEIRPGAEIEATCFPDEQSYNTVLQVSF